MSFNKSLKCYFCSTSRSLKEENFPEDLYDLISRYSIEQLLWVCNSCKNDIDQNKTPCISCMRNKRNEIRNVNELDVKKLNTTSSECYKFKKQESYSEDTVNSGSDSQSLPSLKNLSLSATPKVNKAARKYIHQVLNQIKIPLEEEAGNKKIISSVLDVLVAEMKKDEEFSCVFNNKFFYTGSAYNDLRITSATEYDIDVVLYLPSYINLVPDLFYKTFAFAKIKWETSPHPNVSASVIKFLEKNSVDNYLSPQSVLSWFQHHLDLALQRIHTYPPSVNSVKNCSSGPARTLVITTSAECCMSIDLVPVFEFDYSVLKGTPIYSEIEKTMGDVNKNKWYLVPKTCQGEIGDVTLFDSRYSWRLDFPNAEKCILHGKECAKNVIKILKILRDKRNWKKIASYYLKMVVMLEIIKNPSSDYWKNGLVFERTIDALTQLKTYLKNKDLPHFLSHQNLLFKLNSSDCNGCSNYLNRIIPEIESEPETIVKILA